MFAGDWAAADGVNLDLLVWDFVLGCGVLLVRQGSLEVVVDIPPPLCPEMDECR
jgi:hypothetical protein